MPNNQKKNSPHTVNPFVQFDLGRVPTPCYVVDEVVIENNLKMLSRVQKESGAKVLLALKAFSMFSIAPLISKYLNGVCASGLNEAKLGREEFKGEVHTYSAAYRPQDFDEILSQSDHIVFNSFSQWTTYKNQCIKEQKSRPHLKFGLRINPEHSEGEKTIYDPCAPCSRMGIKSVDFKGHDLKHITGLHFHSLCEQNYEPLGRTLDVVEEKFAHILPQLEWMNFGGGHHITDENYEIDKLVERIIDFQKKWQLQVYIEPGEAIALNAGVLVTEVLDTVHNHMDLAILDTSATCHMPDVLEMPYRPRLTHAGMPGEFKNTYRLGGPSCLAGDVIGEYSFDQPLNIGQRLMFEDMAIYTMVKNTTFNGIGLPSIALWNSESNDLHIIKNFEYSDFKSRLS